MLGSRWVGQRADAKLAGAARNALAKIASVLRAELRYELDATGLLPTLAHREPIRSGERLRDQLAGGLQFNARPNSCADALSAPGLLCVGAGAGLRNDRRALCGAGHAASGVGARVQPGGR